MPFRSRHIIKSDLVRNSSKLLSANVVAQAVALLVYPILTRMFSQEDFGLMNLFLSIGGIMVLLSTFEYHYAIVLPKSESEGRSLFSLVIVSVAVVSILVLLTVPFTVPISRLFNAPDLARWYWLMPLYVLAMGLWQALSYWYTRQRGFGRISGYQVGQSVANSAIKVGWGAARGAGGGLIVGSVAAPVLAVGVSVVRSWRSGLLRFGRIDRSQLSIVAARYRNFPLYNLPKSLLNSFSSNLPILLLTSSFGLSQIGFLGMAFTLALRPVQMVCSSFYQVLYQRVAQLLNEGRSMGSFFRVFVSRYLLVAVPVSVVLYLVLPWLTRVMLGEGWQLTGTLIRLMLPWLVCVGLNCMINFLPDIFMRQRGLLIFEVLGLLLRLGGLLVGMYVGSFRVAVVMFFAASALLQLLQVLWMLYLVRSYDNRL